MFVENLSYVVVEGVRDKRIFEHEECDVCIDFFLPFFVSLHVSSVRRSGHLFRLCFICIIETSACLSLFMKIAFFTVH